VVDGAAVGGAPTGGLRTGPAFGDGLGRVPSSEVSSSLGAFRAPLKIIAFFYFAIFSYSFLTVLIPPFPLFLFFSFHTSPKTSVDRKGRKNLPFLYRHDEAVRR